MKAPGKLTLILMHDDGKAHRLRVGRKLFFMLMTLVILLPVLGGLGTWVGYEAWKVWSSFEQDRSTLLRNLEQWRMRAERLENILQLAGVSTDDTNGLVPASNSPTFPLAAPGRVVANSTAAVSSNATLPVSTPAAHNATLPAGNATLPATAQHPATTVTAENPEAADTETAALDTGVVRLENLTARVLDNRKIRVALDLYNARPNGGPIGGHFVIRLIDPTGKPLPLQHEEGNFRITRFKKVIMQAELPQEVAAADNAALLVTVVVDDEPVLQKIYSVESR